MYTARCEDKSKEIQKAVDALKEKTSLGKPAIIARLLEYALKDSGKIFKDLIKE